MLLSTSLYLVERHFHLSHDFSSPNFRIPPTFKDKIHYRQTQKRIPIQLSAPFYMAKSIRQMYPLAFVSETIARILIGMHPHKRT